MAAVLAGAVAAVVAEDLAVSDSSGTGSLAVVDWDTFFEDALVSVDGIFLGVSVKDGAVLVVAWVCVRHGSVVEVYSFGVIWFALAVS